MYKRLVIAAVWTFALATTVVMAGPNNYSGGDGSSMDKAVVIHATSDREGTLAEYAWLREFHPGSKMTNQALVSSGGRKFDVLETTDPTGSPRRYYFDISESFGK